MTLAVCFGGLALCAFIVLLLYGRELRRMAVWLRMRDGRSNGRMATEMPWGAVVAEAVRMGYTSHKACTCGLHVHVNRSAFGPSEEAQEAVIARILFFV